MLGTLPVICVWFSLNLHFSWDLLQALVYREHLSDHADSLAGHALAKEYTHAGSHIFRMADKLEHHRGRVIRTQLLAAHDAAYDRRLANAADVHRGLKANIYSGRVEQHRYLGLKT